MSFKSMIRELRGMTSSSSSSSENHLKKQSERKCVLGRGRSYIAPESSPSSPGPSLQQSQWANLTPELLLDIIQRVEACETFWPGRRDVVACAAVCRSWREVTKEVVRTPEQCGLLTFPMSVKQPGPRDYPIQCFIRRERATSTFRLYLGLGPALSGNASKLMLAAKKVRRATKTEFLISFTAGDFSRANDNYIGKLRSNFLGTKFVIYDSQPLCNHTVHSSGQSRLEVNSHEQISYNLPEPPESIEDGKNPLVLRNKAPRWHEQLQCWCLNFKGRVTVASVKNFQLVAAVDPSQNIPVEEQEKVILQFGKIGKDIFTMDYRFPLSAFQAFAICLSSFDTKPACE